jgi:hypothetical protein
MRVTTAIALALATLLSGSGAAHGGRTATGVLAGVTQISYGCPGPQREGEQCERWSVLPHARFRVEHAGAPRQTVTSDALGRFRLALAAGRYVLTPLPQAHTSGGARLAVAVRAGRTSSVRVRFQGVPRML